MFTIYLIEDHRMKPYVGMTSYTAEERLQRHKIEARQGKETYLYRAMRKYGTEKFEVVFLDAATTQKEAYELEKKWIQRLGTYKNWGYNMTPGGDGAPSGEKNHNYGQTVSKEVREKMSASSRGERSDSTLNRKQAKEVKWLAKNSDLLQKEIAQKYDIKQPTVSGIKNDESWTHVNPQKP